MTETVRLIVSGYLRAMRYDGLYNTDGLCACRLGDLFPCSEIGESCRAGWLQAPGSETIKSCDDYVNGEWCIGPIPPGETEEEP